jgi:hypothetical protein
VVVEGDHIQGEEAEEEDRLRVEGVAVEEPFLLGQGEVEEVVVVLQT